MKKKILVLMVAFVLMGVNAYAGNGDLIVNGTVGIGTTSPDTGAKMTIVSPSTAALFWQPGTFPATGFLGYGTAADYGTTNNNVLIGASTASSANLIFKTGGGTRMLITNTGNCGIGLSSPSYQLQLSADSAGKPSTSTWTIVSDARLKTNVQPYTKGLKEILQINPVNFKYNGKGGIGRYKITKTDPVTGEDVLTDFVDTELLSKTNVGVIAQDIQAVVPESVSSHKGKINEDDKEAADLLDFNSHPLIFILINAVKELSAQIDSLNQEIADLKAKLK